MSKRIKVFMAVLAAVLLLGMGGAAAVMADEDPDPTQETGGKGLLARVAQILEISQEDLSNAFKQAREEFRQEKLNRTMEKGSISPEQAEKIRERWEHRLELSQAGAPDVFLKLVDKAEEQGRITSGEAGEIRVWWEQRPETLNSLLPHARNLSAITGRRATTAPDIFLKLIDKAEEQGRIEPSDAEEIRDWWGERPEALNRLLPSLRVMSTVHGRQMIAVSKGWHGLKPGNTE